MLAIITIIPVSTLATHHARINYETRNSICQSLGNFLVTCKMTGCVAIYRAKIHLTLSLGHLRIFVLSLNFCILALQITPLPYLCIVWNKKAYHEYWIYFDKNVDNSRVVLYFTKDTSLIYIDILYKKWYFKTLLS